MGSYYGWGNSRANIKIYINIDTLACIKIMLVRKNISNALMFFIIFLSKDQDQATFIVV